MGAVFTAWRGSERSSLDLAWRHRRRRRVGGLRRTALRLRAGLTCRPRRRCVR